MAEVREWDGRSYDRISGPMEALGLEVLERLPLRGDETVLDAGCGSGRITAGADRAAAARACDRRRRVAVDGRAARERLARGGRAASSTCSSWSSSSRSTRSSRPRRSTGSPTTSACSRVCTPRCAPAGGWSRSAGRGQHRRSCAADANAVLAREPYAEHFRDWRRRGTTPGRERTRERLLAAGFAEAECWLQPAPQEPEHPREFLATIVLGPHVQQLPAELREPFLDEVLAAAGEPRRSSTTCG